MKFEIGKKYLTRDGRVAKYVGCVDVSKWSHKFHMEEGGYITTTDSGSESPYGENVQSPLDIVSEAEPTNRDVIGVADASIAPVPYTPPAVITSLRRHYKGYWLIAYL